MFFYNFFKCYKLHLKNILKNKFFEINFLKTFLCSKTKSKCPKNPKKTFLHFFFSSCVIGTPVNVSEMTVRRRAVILKLNFSKSYDHKKSFFIGT
jgi:hypothetical protein